MDKESTFTAGKTDGYTRACKISREVMVVTFYALTAGVLYVCNCVFCFTPAPEDDDDVGAL
jgi:hypothetical protein